MCVAATGTTITFTDGQSNEITIGRIAELGEFAEMLTDIEDNDIETTGHNQYCPGNLIEHDELPFTVILEGQAMPNLDGANLTCVVQFPAGQGFDTGASLTGTGYLRQRGFDGAVNNERITGSYAFRFDGKNGLIGGFTHVPPTWAPATTNP